MPAGRWLCERLGIHQPGNYGGKREPMQTLRKQTIIGDCAVSLEGVLRNQVETRIGSRIGDLD